jgi:hypothetical protein
LASIARLDVRTACSAAVQLPAGLVQEVTFLRDAATPLLGVDFLGQPDFDQRLIRHIALVGGDLDAIE